MRKSRTNQQTEEKMTNSPAELSLECVDSFLKNIIKSPGLEAHLVPVSSLLTKPLAGIIWPHGRPQHKQRNYYIQNKNIPVSPDNTHTLI